MDKKEKLYKYIIDEVVNDTKLYWSGDKICFMVGFYGDKSLAYYAKPYFNPQKWNNNLYDRLRDLNFRPYISNRYGSSKEESLMLWDRYVDVICDRIRTMEYKRLPKRSTSSSTTII